MRIIRSMVKSFIPGIVIIAALTFSGVAVTGAVVKTDAGNSNSALRIIYSGGLTGNIEPCG